MFRRFVARQLTILQFVSESWEDCGLLRTSRNPYSVLSSEQGDASVHLIMLGHYNY